MLEEVVEDALELEDQKVAATKAMNALTDKAVSMHTKALVYDERLRTMRTFFIIQSICGLILAGLILYIHSGGSCAIISDSSVSSTLLLWLPQFCSRVLSAVVSQT